MRSGEDRSIEENIGVFVLMVGGGIIGWEGEDWWRSRCGLRMGRLEYEDGKFAINLY